ncbi:uncharacterized protein LOC119609391 [Lucilia sericata]|uniref:uncharacterized protein LOC119609391 n=1 Tax=Lucilia sericata TaxID=13632 RepID=UPI0018A87595|nr:uncharacterized protein LOC119609391 [Lucilia sericata]
MTERKLRKEAALNALNWTDRRDSNDYRLLLNQTTSDNNDTERITDVSRKETTSHKNHLLALNTDFEESNWGLQDIIKQAFRILKLETLVLFAECENHLQILENVENFEYNKIIITQLQDRPLREWISGNILSIVFIDGPEINDQILNILMQSLERWHMKKLLLISQTLTIEPVDRWRKLLQCLYEQGFWNSLLIDQQANTLTMDPFSLELLKNNISIELFLQLTIDWKDLQGFPVQVSMANNPPRALLYYDAKNRLQLKGLFGNLINLFAQIYNASLVPHQISNLDYYRELDCLKYIAENKVDLCGDAMALNPQYVMSKPVIIARSYLMVPYDKPLPQVYYFFKPFQTYVWYILLLAFIFNVMALALIHRLQHKSWSFSLQLLYVCLSFIHLPFQLKRLKGPLRRHWEMLLILMGFVISNWYLSLLASLLYTRLYSQDIQSLQDLQRLNISIMVNEFEYSLLNVSAVDPIIMQQLLLVADNVLLENRRNLNPHYAYYSQYDKNSFYLHQQKFLLRPIMKELSKEPINSVLGGIPMRYNWPFEHLLNNIMDHILESGLFDRLLLDSLEDGIRSGYLKYFATEHCYVVPLSLEYFQVPGIILALGCLMGFIFL